MSRTVLSPGDRVMNKKQGFCPYQSLESQREGRCKLMTIKWGEYYYERLNLHMNRFGDSNLAETGKLNHLSQRITSVKIKNKWRPQP